MGISAWSGGNVVPILVFHSVDNDSSEHSVAPHDFERHMKWLSPRFDPHRPGRA